MTDSKTRDTEGVPTTSFLPDHLVAGEPNGLEAAATNESATDDGDEDADPASEFCRSWRSHLAGGRGGAPF